MADCVRLTQGRGLQNVTSYFRDSVNDLFWETAYLWVNCYDFRAWILFHYGELWYTHANTIYYKQQVKVNFT